MQFGIVYLKDFNKIVLIMDAPENNQGALEGRVESFSPPL